MDHNLACAYYFFLDKELLYPDSHFRMSDEVLEAYIQQLIEAHGGNQVTVAWQGGELTLWRRRTVLWIGVGVAVTMTLSLILLGLIRPIVPQNLQTIYISFTQAQQY